MEIANIILEYLKVLIWPIFLAVVLITYRKPIRKIIDKIKRVELGDISIDTIPGKIIEAQELSEKVMEERAEQDKSKSTPTLPLNQVNTKMMNLGLTPSSTGLEFRVYRDLANRDPNLALAGLRIEFEMMSRNLAKGFKVEINERDSINSIVNKLRGKGAITSRQEELMRLVIKLCNAAVHGIKVSINQANEIIDIAELLRDDYVSWLSWGFLEATK